MSSDFYPRSPCGERPPRPSAAERGHRFLSTLSLRRATSAAPLARRGHWPFLSTLSLRRATSDPVTDKAWALISIHALLAESDRQPRAQADRPPPFLSTLSLRRATSRLQNGKKRHNNFYPRSPCGERPVYSACQGATLYFYPRSPCGERPALLANLRGLYSISIHALLAESDCNQLQNPYSGPHFYPRSPCGERRQPAQLLHKPRMISIHALLAESDPGAAYISGHSAISIHALLAESDAACIFLSMPKKISIHALLAESDTTLM